MRFKLLRKVGARLPRRLLLTLLLSCLALSPLVGLAPLGDHLGLVHTPTASADLGPCPADPATPGYNAGRAIAGYSSLSVGTIILCEQTVGSDIPYFVYWAVWEKGPKCDSMQSVAVIAFLQLSSHFSQTYVMNQCQTRGGYVAYDPNYPGTCGRASAITHVGPNSYTWRAPSNNPDGSGRYQCP